MKIKHQDLEIPQDNPFSNCKLDRKQYAMILTDIVNTYADGFVLAINNEWGTGKTTFVKMWQQHLNNENFQTIYFNAWENDFDSNPLVAIMSELKTLTKNGDKAFKSVIEKGAVIAKNVLPALLKGVAQKYIDTEILTDAIENITKGAAEILEEEIKEYANKKETITEFKKELEKFIKQSTNDKPLVFIIDELDRCRPTYAVEVLEQMKHFFSVHGIVFVLSIDKNHLASAVRGFYGSEQINTDEYLRRFIDLEYSIPQPSETIFSKYLFDYYLFNDFFTSAERGKYREFQSDADMFLETANLLFNKSKATLRQQEKMFSQTRLVLKSFKSNQYVFSHLLIFLIYIKTIKSELYEKIKSNAITLQELSDEFSNSISSEINTYKISLIYVEALLLHFYNNNREHQNREKLFENDTEGNLVSVIKSKLENDEDKKDLPGCLSEVAKNHTYYDANLKLLLNKIDLTDPMYLIRQ